MAEGGRFVSRVRNWGLLLLDPCEQRVMAGLVLCTSHSLAEASERIKEMMVLSLEDLTLFLLALLYGKLLRT